jgi:hypothetical protein
LAISTCSKAGKWKDGLKLLEDMKKEAPLQNDNNSGHMMSYTAAIAVCAEEGKVAKIISIINHLLL